MTIASERPIKTSPGRGWPGRALAWWVGELHSAYDDAARRVGAARGNALTIEAGERYWILRRQQRPVGQLDWQSDPDHCRDALRELVGRAPVIEIPPERLLSKIVQFPVAARGQLDRIIEFEIARHFPFPAERVFFRHRVIERRGATVTGDAPIAVEIVAVPREVVAGICDELRVGGIEPRGIALVSGGDAAPLFLPAASFGARPARSAAPTRVAAAGLGLAMAGAAISWPLAQQTRLAAMDRQIAALKPHADGVLRARDDQRQQAERLATIVQSKTGRPALVATLDRLSRNLPDGSWLSSLSISGRDVVIEGLSPSAATIALALERSHAFTAITFRSPISKDPSTGLEHFQLGATTAEVKP